MKALVVYESLFGNTEQVARAIAKGLTVHGDVVVCEVTKATPVMSAQVDLIVVGGPTHAFAMTPASTRENAFQQGATHGPQAVGVREWLRSQRKGPHPEVVAMFDTRVVKVRHLPGSVARGAAAFAKKLGFAAAAKPESFYVQEATGPLVEGELARAQAWGEGLGAVVAGREASG